MHVGGWVRADPLQHIDQVVVGVDAVQPTGHDQALHDANVLVWAPNSVQMKSQAFRLCIGMHNRNNAKCGFMRSRTGRVRGPVLNSL